MDHALTGISTGAVSPIATAPTARRAGAPPLLERIAVLDILRGLALLGMFAVHFNLYEATPLGAEPGRAAAFVERFLGLFFDERFWGIFGMLFGVGFAVQLERSAARGEPFVAKYLRRLAVLAVFGFIAEGVFGYNVLFGYAMWGIPLLLIRRWPVKALVVLFVLCAAARPIYSTIRVAIADTRPGGVAQFNAKEDAEMAAFRAARDSLKAAEQSGSWRTVVAARLAHMPVFHRRFSLLPNGSFTLFLIGLIVWKLGLFTRPEAHKRLIVSLMIGGVATTVLANFVLPFGGPPTGPPSMETPVLSAFVMYAKYGFHLLRPQWLALTYIGIVLLLVTRGQQWVRRLAPLGWVGRMALTNYMMQVVLLDVLFTPHGLGLKIPALLVFPGAIALFTAQVFMSRWWLSRFRFGPLEWIWRSATRWKLEPLRIESPAVAVALAA